MTTAMTAAITHPIAVQSSDEYLIFNEPHMSAIFRVAEIMSTGKTTIPAHLRGNPGDCMAVCLQAAQWKMNPMAVAQKTHLVNGTLGYEAQLIIAVINTRAPIKGRLRFEWDGDWSAVKGKECREETVGVTVAATFLGDDEPTRHRVSMKQAGVRNSPLWEHDPKMQLAYLAAKRWARVHCPEVILGVYTPDELEVSPIEEAPAPAPSSRVEALKARLQSVVVPAEPEPAPTVDAQTGEIARPDNLDALLTSINLAANRAVLRALKEKVMAVPAPFDLEAKAAYREKLAGFESEVKA